MPIQATNSFTSYTLTEQELLIGSVLTSLQKCCIQNQLADLAERKLNLKFDPAHPQIFLQEEAELQGNLNALRYLLTLSESAESTLSARNSQEN